MKIKRQFLTFFIVFIAVIISITAIIAIMYMNNSFTILKNCTNPSLIPIMAERMYNRFLIGFSIVLITIITVAIPVGLFLSRTISDPYLSVIKDLINLGRKRLSINEEKELPDNEIDTLRTYSTILMDDFIKIKEYEKVHAWKEGARMLIHEIKNPLTPLKLSAQKLYLNDSLPPKDKNDINRILTASSDIENILRCFKELVNINFAPKEYFYLSDFLNEIQKANPNIVIKNIDNISNNVINSEKSLLKMLFVNLINNGIEENSHEFYLEIKDIDNSTTINFITPNREIEDTSRIFKLGYSSKGKQRGFGLFLCRKISQYLELSLKCINSKRGVEFIIKFTNE